MSKELIQAIFSTAYEKRQEADAAREAMAAVLLNAMRRLLPAGTILKLDQRPIPEYLIRVRTMSGNDRGTRVFRVEQVVRVEADPSHPELSTWICDAVPISEKTGKDMSAATHGANSRTTVRLHGDIGYLGIEESTEAARDRLLQMVANAVAAE
ncbi:hypothetical protein KTD31_01395 [Burkholderia multivorans]|uniref:hypothetical protein n=1 Tax=Burkholderia multivorans TaxID=87883 RepID=UPI001C238E19|nr:hypothetical protein [Burkholderia multivorans]MBU9200057.1 hypothetical protein [Burkholderia multivorans]